MNSLAFLVHRFGERTIRGKEHISVLHCHQALHAEKDFVRDSNSLRVPERSFLGLTVFNWHAKCMQNNVRAVNATDAALQGAR